MSYIKCKSIVTGQDVQYGLIDVSLKHKKRDLDYGCGNTNLYTAFWNTAPEASSTYSAVAVSGQNPPWNIEFGSDGMKTVTGRPTQGWDASGELVSQYGYVHRGTQPIISNQVIDVENLSHGINTVDLFETDNIKVQMEIAKLKPSEFLLPNMYSLASFKREDGSYADKSLLDVIAAVVIKQIYKPENKVVGTYSYLDKIGSQCFPNKFTVTTEVFRIKDFDPRYTTWQQFDFDRSMWFDKGNTDQNTILKEGQNVSAKSDCVVMNFSVMATDWWSASRNYFDYTQLKVVDSNGSEISNNTLRSLIASGVRKYLLHCIDDTPSDFITFVQAINAYNAIPYSPYGDALTYMNSQVNGNGDYKITGYGVTNTTIFTVDNTVLSPLLIPHVDSNWNPTDATTNGTFIPLTDTVFEGDPEPPEEEETLEEAIDGDTDWEADQSDGEVDYFDYLRNDVIGGMPAAVNAYRPSYSNFIFRRWRDDSTNPSFNKQVAQYFITDTDLVGTSSVLQSFFKLVTGKPDPSDIISRIYALPFEYTEIIDMNSYVDPNEEPPEEPFEEPEASGATTKECVPCYGVAGPCLGVATFSGSGDDTTVDHFTIHYYDRLTPRFLQIELGEITVQKIFFNYLDYQTQYKLHLPYGAGDIEIDPSFLFRENTGIDTHVGDIERRNSGTIHLVGWIDFDSATLFIKVIINGDLYYETIVDIGIDMIPAYMGQGSIITAMGRLGMAAVGTLATKGIIGKAAGALAEGTFKAGQFVRNALPHTVSIEPYFEPDMPEGLPMKDIIYGEDLSSQRFGEQVVQGMQEMASTPRLGYNGMIYGTMNPEPETPNMTAMMADKIMDQMLETNRMNQRLFNLQFPYCEVPPTNLGR